MNEKPSKIRVGICGYGNLGKGAELAVKQTHDMELKVIFTRRSPAELQSLTDVPVVHISEVDEWTNQLDVVILCGGSKNDLPKQVPEFASKFNTVNTFDTHADISYMYDEADVIAKKASKISVISTGWDPGMFSLMRVLFQSIYSDVKIYTTWGKGVSQGHSDAIRKIDGVKNAIQYTIPIEEKLEEIRSGKDVEYTSAQLHKRQCFVAADEEEYERIEKEIKQMPKYFADYETEVNFVSEKEISQMQMKMFHGGFVICVATTPTGNKQIMEFKLTLDSNPEFTGSVAVMYAMAAVNMNKRGESGAKLVTEIPFYDLMTEDVNTKFKFI